jgi:Protein of unknown function (DUF1460)
VYSGKWLTDSVKRILKSALYAVLFMTSLLSFNSNAQTLSDDSIFVAKIKQAKAERIDTLPIGERVAAMGKLFLGTPYVAHTLDSDATKEQVVVDLRGFDCVTFYENMLAFARIIKKYPSPTMENLREELRLLRYRDGKIDGFHSRLNYTIDYFRNNEKKDVLANVTDGIGTWPKGVWYLNHDIRTINFMTSHRSSYKQLAKSDVEYKAMLEVEKNINAWRGFDYIPKEDIAKMESNIGAGNIIGITTNIAGLDCSHTGIAIRMPDGRIYFMHASSLMGKVIISDDPLADYLTHSSHQTGIIVARPQDVTSTIPDHTWLPRE